MCTLRTAWRRAYCSLSDAPRSHTGDNVSVYVDDARLPFGRMKMCHMVADTTEELLEMADRIEVNRKWVQRPGEAREHFDISLTKRALAVQFGAVEVSTRDIVRLTRETTE